MKVEFCLVVGLLSFSLVGCKKGDTSPAAGSSSSKPAAMPKVPAVASSEPAPPPPGEPGTSSAPAPVAPAAAPQPEGSKDPVVLITEGLMNFMLAKERAPKDLNELVSTGYLKALPTPPPGKKFAYEPTKLAVTLVNQ